MVDPNQSRWQQLRDRILLPIDPPTDFPEPEEDLEEQLRGATGPLGIEVLRQANEYYEEAFDRASKAEQRASTLLGAVAIAASFTIAGATFLLDSEKVSSAIWRSLFAAIYSMILVSLFATALRSLRALSVQVWAQPDVRDLLRPLPASDDDARRREAVQLLSSGSRNQPVARWKIAQLNGASWWFARAVSLLLILVGLIVVFVVTKPEPKVIEKPSSRLEQSCRHASS